MSSHHHHLLTTLALALSIVLFSTHSLAELIIDNGQFVVLDPSGITSQSVEFSSKKVLSPVPEIILAGENTIKVTFEILKKSDKIKAKPISPHQVTILATGLDTSLNWLTPVKTRSAGKSKWELDLARAPTDFLSLTRTGQVQLQLIIGDISSNDPPLQFNLPTLKIPKGLLLEYPYWDTNDGKAPPSLELERYYVQPKLQWAFKPPRKKENPAFSLAFVLISLSPWALLLTTWTKLSRGSEGGFKLISRPKMTVVLFILTLAAQEVLILTYWVRLRLYQYIPLALLSSLPLILSGRSALTELRVRRKINPISSAHVTTLKLLGLGDKDKNQ